MTKKKIDRIKELTDEEKAEQAALRQEYRDGVKANLEGQLKNIEIVDKEQ